MSTTNSITLKSAEEQFAPLLSGMFSFIIDKCHPGDLEHLLRQINEFVDLAKHLGISGVKKSSLLADTEIKNLVAVITPLCGRHRGNEAIRAILREAMQSHQIPNEL